MAFQTIDDLLAQIQGKKLRSALRSFLDELRPSDRARMTLRETANSYEIIVSGASRINDSGDLVTGGAVQYLLDKATGDIRMGWHEHPMVVPDLGDSTPIPEGKMGPSYVHGYDQRENLRLQDQAATLVELLHSDTFYPAGSRVLEAGCGVGAQTVTLAQHSPEAQITSVDISKASVLEAKRRITAEGLDNVRFEQADIFDLPYGPETFDHIFVCFVLEHLTQPVRALVALKKHLRPGGTITVIEGDHGSVFFHPDSEFAHTAIRCQVELQRHAGGDAMIGRALYPLLYEAGFEATRVSPRMVYVDASKPALVEGFTKKTFTAMVEGVRESAIAAGIVEPQIFDQGIRDLYRTTEPDGVFCYTFFKAVGNK